MEARGREEKRERERERKEKGGQKHAHTEGTCKRIFPVSSSLSSFHPQHSLPLTQTRTLSKTKNNKIVSFRTRAMLNKFVQIVVEERQTERKTRVVVVSRSQYLLGWVSHSFAAEIERRGTSSSNLLGSEDRQTRKKRTFEVRNKKEICHEERF